MLLEEQQLASAKAMAADRKERTVLYLLIEEHKSSTHSNTCSYNRYVVLQRKPGFLASNMKITNKKRVAMSP